MNDTLSAAQTYEFLRKVRIYLATNMVNVFINLSENIQGFSYIRVLVQWLMDHPKFSNNPLYIAGDSYSGIVVPIIVQEISDGKLFSSPHRA